METFRDLMRLAHGFELARIFLTAVSLDLFTALAGGRRVKELAEVLSLDARALELCLNALVAGRLVVKRGDRYDNGPLAARYLVAGPDYRGHIFRHIHHCWESWHELPEVLRSGSPGTIRENHALGEDEERTRDFIRGMDDVTCELAPEVVGRLDLEGVRVVLDVGGGPGRYARTFLETHPGVEKVILFDLPGALAVARENLERWGLADRVELVAGDFHRDPLPAGADLVWISQILHSQGEEDARALLAKAHGALRPGGTVYVHEFLLGEERTGPLPAALFAVHMLVMTAAGRAYSGTEIAAWLEQAGFAQPRLEPAGPDTGLVRAVRPEKP